ncbi:MAG: hypothetical protein GEV05_21870 [Betaproteobacteria bacterium]|nr:hypothetical protein [Betaproteobacteria bacterium]
MEADSFGSLSTALESSMRRIRKLVSNACGTHARTIKISAALGSALLLFSVSSDAFAPLRQWMIAAFEAEYPTPGQAGLDRGDAPSETTSQQAHDAAIQVALAHVGPIRLGSSGESGDIFWTISDSMSTSNEYQAGRDLASSDVYRSGFTAAQRYGAGGQRSRMPLLAFGLPSHLYPSQHLAGIAGPAGMMLSGGSLSEGDSDSLSQTDSDSQPQDNSRGAEIHPALEEGADGDKNPQRSDSGADGGPLGAPNEELPTDNAGSLGDPVITGDNSNGTVPPISVLDDGLAKKIDEPVLQELSLPHNGGIATPSTGQEDYPDFTQLRISDESVEAATSVPLPGTLALIVLALPMLVSFHGRLASKRM